MTKWIFRHHSLEHASVLTPQRHIPAEIRPAAIIWCQKADVAVLVLRVQDDTCGLCNRTRM